MEAARSSETLVPIYQYALRNISADWRHHHSRSKTLKSCTLQLPVILSPYLKALRFLVPSFVFHFLLFMFLLIPVYSFQASSFFHFCHAFIYSFICHFFLLYFLNLLLPAFLYWIDLKNTNFRRAHCFHPHGKTHIHCHNLQKPKFHMR
jgi:hypothetical protein